MDKLRIGIIGTGGIAHKHVKAYLMFDDVEIVAGADIVPGKARAFLDEFGLKNAVAYESAEALAHVMTLMQYRYALIIRSMQIVLFQH